MAATLAEVVADPERARAMGAAGRARAVDEFSWGTVAERTLAVYQTVLR
jgi:starch synthase